MENVYIKIDNIPGEAREKQHVGWIPVKSIEWNLERTLDMTDLGTTQRGYANTNFGKISVTTELSKASAKLMGYVASGKASKELIIHMCRSGDSALMVQLAPSSIAASTSSLPTNNSGRASSVSVAGA